MKTVWIINHYADPPNVGKFNRHYHFAKKLIERGYEVKIFTASTIHSTDINLSDSCTLYTEKNYDGVDYVIIGCPDYEGNGRQRIKNMLKYYKKVVKASAFFGKCDMVYASSPHPLTWIAGRKIAEKNNAKFIAETRDLWPETFISMGKFSKSHPVVKILYAIEKKIYKKADKLIFTMPGGVDYVESLGISTDKVVNINNGVDLKEFADFVEKYKVELPFQKDEFNVVYAGAMGQANRVKCLVEAMNLLKDNWEIKLYIYGSGYEEEELKDFCTKNGVSNVKFMGRVEKKYIPYIISSSHLNVMTARKIDLYKYGISLNKLFEYMAAGKPILSNIECNYDILEKYNCGLTVEGESPKALAEGIEKFYNMDSKEYESYSLNSIRASKDFDFEVLTDKLEKCFE